MKSVRFNANVDYYYMEDPEGLYKEARNGSIWTREAVDRIRFKRRVEKLAPILNRMLIKMINAVKVKNFPPIIKS